MSPEPEPARPVVLIIDDGGNIARFCREQMPREHDYLHATDAREARKLLAARSDIAAILLDRDFSLAPPDALLGPGDDVRNEGLRILQWLRQDYPRLPVIMVTSFRSGETAARVVRLGGDFIALEEVLAQPAALAGPLRRALAASRPPDQEILALFRRQGIVAESAAMQRALVELHPCLRDRYPILLQGETGTGKDTLAAAIHALGPSATGAFVSLNIAAVPPSLFEAELFGYRKGSFTGALRDYAGRFLAADGGTLFLNEITELPLDLQAKLLTASERGEVVPIGAVESAPFDCRIVSASSQDPWSCVRAGTFRADLLYRIRYHSILLPPLRERREDIPVLARTFLHAASAARTEAPPGFSREALEYLEEQPWPGNIRQLASVVAVAAARAAGMVTIQDVHESLRRSEQRSTPPAGSAVGEAAAASEATAAPGGAAGASWREEAFSGRSYEELTREYYRYLWDATGGRRTKMAELAGLARSTLYEWHEKFGPGSDSDDTEVEEP